MDIRIRAAVDKMRDWHGEGQSIRNIAKSVNLSPRRLAELFKAEMGVSPTQYLRSLRMQKAQALLESSFLTVKEVSFQSGFRDVSHFVRDFKQRYGMTPREFRSERSRFNNAQGNPPIHRRFR
jgi:transcriptional regulator GlxA family with amidase domain